MTTVMMHLETYMIVHDLSGGSPPLIESMGVSPPIVYGAIQSME